MKRDITAALAQVETGLGESLERLSELIAIPSDAIDKTRHKDCEDAAKWLHQTFEKIGFEGGVKQTQGQPIVLMRRPSRAPSRRVLFYAHYDIQPEGPEREWSSPPFAMEVRNGAIYGRGASDNKGQMMTVIEAIRILVAQDAFDLDVTVLIEGEEEIGSPSLPAFLQAHPELSDVDVIYVCDNSMWDVQTPAICTRLRGLVSDEVSVRVAAHDRHSGQFGGIAPNAAHLLIQALSSLHDAEGRIQVPGFYDDVVPPPAAEWSRWNALRFDPGPYEGLFAASDQATLLRKLWSEPSLELGGLVSGHIDEGFKTIIPAMASAKIGIRLVEGQDPDRIRHALRLWLKSQLPSAADVDFTAYATTPACVVEEGAPALSATRNALDEEWPNPTALIGGAGTIPVVGMFQDILGKAPLLVGFGLADDGAHGPDEHYALSSFVGGTRSWIRILSAL
ncbi:M20/M25/M40 family metallo-hydrolase [Aliiroseovarius sp. 2305UL8-7]|uniref:M20/M25/M40 family metallo-hydrolase n=1 Tax=Aliiroseovarius conchicola TaxID=3121637 RepID=UPI003526E3A2